MSQNTQKIDTLAVGDRVKKFRKRHGHTQATFAILVGTDQKEISRVERGKFPSRKMIDGLISRYGMDAHWLLTGEGQMEGAQPMICERPEGYQSHEPPAQDLAGGLQESVDMAKAGNYDEAVGRALRAIADNLLHGRNL